jgi:hypothetical protein
MLTGKYVENPPSGCDNLFSRSAGCNPTLIKASECGMAHGGKPLPGGIELLV